MAKLIIQFEGVERTFEFKEEETLVLGRSSKCGLSFKDSALSREHCHIKKEEGRFIVADWESRNGTKVNGKTITKAEIKPGDVISIGNVLLHFEKIKREEPEEETDRSESTDRHIERLPHALNDFAVAAPPRRSRALIRIAVWVSLFALLTVGAVILAGKLRKEKTETSPANLLTGNPSFERISVGKNPDGWRIVGERKSWLSVDSSTAKEGSASLAVDKQPDPEEFEIECLNTKPIPLKGLSALRVSAWVKGGSVAALAGIKVAWEEEGRSQPILTDRRLQKIESPDWIEVAEEFPAPPKAATAKISLVIVGRNGVVRFDDVSVTGRKGTERIKKISLGIFDVLVSSNGHVSLFRAGTPIALDCRLGIFSRNGASRFFVRRAEVTETPPSAASPSGRLSIAAELVNPVNLDIIPCTIDLRHAAGDLTLTYTLPREPLLQIEGVELACALRNPDALAVIPGSGALPSRVSFTAGRFPLILEYFEPLKTAQTTIGSDLLLTATRDLSTKTSSTADAAFVIGFTLGEPIMLKENAVREEMEKAKRAMTSKTYGEALTLFGKLRRAINDVQILREIEENIKTIQGIEVARRREIELSLMEAQILLRPGDLEKLKRLIATYLAEFAGTAQADTMKEDGASIDLLVADAAGDIRQERAETLSKYAQDFFERGMARLAAMTAEKAESLLKGISDGGK